MAKFAIIGGTGFSQHADDFEVIHTDYGDVNVGKIMFGEQEVLYIYRHENIKAPNEVNFRANIEALKILNVDTVFGISACGRISNNVVPGNMILPTNLVRMWGLGSRETSFGEEGLIVHTGPPFFDRDLSSLVEQAYHEVNPRYDLDTGLTPGYHNKGIYAVINGPSFADPVEEKILKTVAFFAGFWKDIVIGMTLFPEATLAHEMGMRYYGLGMCTDYSSTPPRGAKPVTHGGVKDVSKLMGNDAFKIVKWTIEHAPKDYQPITNLPIFEKEFDYPVLSSSRPQLANIIRSYFTIY